MEKKTNVIENFSDINDLLSKIKKIRDNETKREEIIITKKLEFKDVSFSDTIEMSDCVFQESIDFSNSTFQQNVKLYKCTFKSTAKFNNTTFNNLVDFYGCIFEQPQQFFKTDFNEVAIFSNATFEKETQFIYCKTKSSSYISFQSAKFKKGFDIARANFNCKVSCWDIQIDDEGLKNAIQSKYYLLDFDFEWWEEKIKQISGNHSILDILSKKHTYINDDLEKILKLPNIHINSIKEELNKWTPASKKLRESMRFIKNNFYAENNRIEGSQFEKKELEIYRQEVKSQSNRFKTKVSEINEPTTPWEKWLKYYDTNILLQIFSLLLIGLMLFLYIIYTHYLFYWLTLIFFIIVLGCHLIHNKLIIKNSIKQNNYIPYTIMLMSICAYFMALYDIYSIKNDDNSFIIDIIFGVIFIAFGTTYLFFNEDKILLFLNKNSNNFGASWMVGVNFTILVSLITYSLILLVLYLDNCIKLDISIKGLGNFLQNMGEIMNVTKWTQLKLFDLNITGWSYVWLFIGRIFIGYGYYQTIQAFRKYGKS